MTLPETEDYREPVRRLIRSTDRASLSTMLPSANEDAAAWPFGSLVMLACDHDATPILLMSDLSEHARNLARDPRASLLIDGTAGLVDALTGPRVTLLGRAVPDADPVLRRRYLSRHPRAGFYAGFADFRIYRFILERCHLVAGFGKVRWLDAGEVNDEAPWREIEPAIIERIADRAEQIARHAGLVARGKKSTPWQIIGIDPEGIDLRAGGDVGRYRFPSRLTSPDEIEAALKVEKAG
jgi:heme iron utilization protein